MRRLRAALPLLLLIATGVVLFTSGALDRLHPEHLMQQQAQMRLSIAESPWLSRLAYIGLLTMVVSTGVPGSLLVILAGGLLFGVVQGTAISSVAVVLGSLLLFLASRYAFGEGRRAAPPLVERLRHGFAAHPTNYTLFLRIAPVFPFGAVTVALAWLRCPMWLFLLATFIGGTTMLVFETAIGAGLGDALANGGVFDVGMLFDMRILLPLGALALMALVPLWFNWRRERRRRALPPTD
jgi:uncharacterized membrane protein YdjX (TVP38/TMEM64 family)